MPRKPPVQKLDIPDLDVFREFTDDQIHAMTFDSRSCGLLAIVYGTTPRRIKEVRRNYVQQLKKQNIHK